MSDARSGPTAGRSLSLLGLMVLVHLVLSIAVVTGLPLVALGLHPDPPRPALLWQLRAPFASEAVMMQLACTPEAVSGDSRALGPERPLLVATPDAVWALALSGGGSPHWDELRIGPEPLSLGAALLLLGGTGRSVEVAAATGEQLAVWTLPAGAYLGPVASGAAGVWISSWQPLRPDLAADWAATARPLSPAITETLLYLTPEGRVTRQWSWSEEVLLSLVAGRGLAYTLSWTLEDPPTALVRQLAAGGGDSWQAVLPGTAFDELRVLPVADPVARAVSAARVARGGAIMDAWPGSSLVLLSAPQRLLALSAAGEVVFERDFEATLIDAVQVGDYVALLKSDGEQSWLAYLDRGGRETSRYPADQRWQGLLSLPWGGCLAWGGPTLRYFDGLARPQWEYQLEADAVTVTAGYADASGRSGLLAIFTADAYLHLLDVGARSKR